MTPTTPLGSDREQSLVETDAAAFSGVAPLHGYYDNPPCVHDWRLIEEKTRREGSGWDEDSRPIAVVQRFVARWYCTRCRLIEETTR